MLSDDLIMEAFSISAETRAEAELVCSRTSGGAVDHRATERNRYEILATILPIASLTTWLFLSAAQAQVIPFSGYFGRGLSPSDNQMGLRAMSSADPVRSALRRRQRNISFPRAAG